MMGCKTIICQQRTLKGIFFFRIPIIMAPKLLRSQVNNDVLKETLYNKKYNHGPNTMAGMANLVRRREINVTDIDSISPNIILKIGKELKLKTSKKSNKMLVDEIKHVAKMYIAGQGKLFDQLG